MGVISENFWPHSSIGDMAYDIVDAAAGDVSSTANRRQKKTDEIHDN